MKDFAEKFYHDTRWIKCRQAYIDKRILHDGGMCEICHEDLGYIVHHKITLTADNINDPEISLNHDNLQYVCHNCHNRIDHFGSGEKSKARCGFTADGQPFIYQSPP